ADCDAANAIGVVDRRYGMSKDMQKLCDELIAQFRNVMVAKAVPENLDLLVCMPSELEKIKSLAERLSIEDIMHKLEILQSCNERIARVSSKRVEMEMCLIKLCTAQSSASGNSAANTELLAKIDMLEQRITAQPMQTGRTVQAAQTFQPAQTTQAAQPS
ncbi:MAG: DNA polymerase III subunit gamma/tau, partial [Oscillospiraceae bacterium]|nr:DNA polymerase III subunit gamma/tau [Oscillospiraceae bacterium]